MTTIHGACCGPSDASNVHRDCPGSWAGWGGEVLVCECSCHEGIALNQRGNGVSDGSTWDNGGSTKDGPERGVGTSGRGLADWIGVD